MTRLDDGVKDFALVVDGAPEIVDLVADRDEYLVEMQAIRRSRMSAAALASIGAAELKCPTAHRLVGDIDAAIGE